MTVASTARSKQVPIAFQGEVWPAADGTIHQVRGLGTGRAMSALGWVETNIDDFYEGHAEFLDDEQRERYDANRVEWWMSTPLYRSLQSEAFDRDGTEQEEDLDMKKTEAVVDESEMVIPLRELPRWPAFMAGVAAIVVAFSAAAISLNAQAEVALKTEATYGWLAWLFPAVIDGGIIAASASIWAWQMEGRKSKRPKLAYSMAGALLAVSAVVNVAHAGDDPLGKFMAALPPFVLLGSIELAAHLKQRRLFIQYAERKELEQPEPNK